MWKSSRMWLAAACTGLVSTSALGQPATPPASLPVTPAQQAAAWQLPEFPQQQPYAGVVSRGAEVPNAMPNEAQQGAINAQSQQAQQQQAVASSVYAAQAIQAQLLANEYISEVQQVNAAQQAQADQAQAADDVPQEQAEPAAQAAEPVQSAATVLSLEPVSALDARGANQGATLRWTLPQAGHAVRYALYCDDGTLSTASTQRTVLASDECPSQVALVAGVKPDAGWSVCGEIDGATSTATLNGLANGEPYAFALAAQDDTGTLGVLSSVSCAIPSQNGEYEFDAPTASTAAAETGEGCSTGTSAAFGSPLLLGGLTLLAVRRRRQRA